MPEGVVTTLHFSGNKKILFKIYNFINLNLLKIFTINKNKSIRKKRAKDQSVSRETKTKDVKQFGYWENKITWDGKEIGQIKIGLKQKQKLLRSLSKRFEYNNFSLKNSLFF